MKNGRIKTFICVCAAVAMLLGSALNAFAATADITEDSVRIRSEASTSGEQVGTGKKGESYKIQETVTGSDGNTWYKVQTTDGKTGYIRGDLVKVKQESTDAGNGDANTATSLAPTETTSIAEAKAVVGGNSSVNIRSGAGTGYAKVASLPAGSELVLVGEADDSSGNKWYQFKCEAKGVEGFIRSDLITITEESAAEEPAEGEGEGEGEGADMPVVEEEPQPVVETPVNNDYEIVYTEDEEGNSAYYLYDHVNNTRQKVNDLMSAVTTLNDKYQDAKDEATNNKLIAIVCGGLALIFAILMVVFIIKYSNASNNGMYDYDDDEDYEDDDRRDRYRDEDDEDEEEEDDEDDDEDNYDRKPQRRTPGNRRNQRPSSGAASRAGASSRNNSYDEAPRKPRKSQNFLVDDDEFEFEFLNMDDKD